MKFVIVAQCLASERHARSVTIKFAANGEIPANVLRFANPGKFLDGSPQLAKEFTFAGSDLLGDNRPYSAQPLFFELWRQLKKLLVHTIAFLGLSLPDEIDRRVRAVPKE